MTVRGNEARIAGYNPLSMAGSGREHVEDRVDAITARIADPTAQPYEQGGKVPHVAPYLHTGWATITTLVPAPQEESGPGLLTATLREASRIQAHIDPATGTTTWGGTSRSPAHGKEYAIDLGEGWRAVYRPYGANDPAEHEYSLRGQLELHAPQGAGHGHQLIRRLGQLNLVNRAMTHAEGEWTYLAANIDAQQLGDHPAVKTALAHAGELEELQLQELYHTHAHQVVGLDEQGLAALAKQWQIEAAAACLPRKVRMVREAVAVATGHADGAALAASPGYDPVPRTSGRWLAWGRFDVGNHYAAVEAAWQGRSLTHHVTGDSLTDLLATGVPASTERRAVMGVAAGKGMSENSDKYSGSANAVFTRVRDNSSVGKGLVRRRCLHWATVTGGPGGGLVFGLASGQVARVEPARGEELAELRRWGDFTHRRGGTGPGSTGGGLLDRTLLLKPDKESDGSQSPVPGPALWERSRRRTPHRS